MFLMSYFFNEIDSITEKRMSDTWGGLNCSQLLTELDGVESRDEVFVMGATTRIDCVIPQKAEIFIFPFSWQSSYFYSW